MVDAVIGNYQLVRQLGKGGMGVVYLGQHRLLGRQAAIKVLLPALSARPDIVNRFFNEARAVTSISDPGIVQVFDFGYHTDSSAFIVMEYLEGEPLDRRLARLGRLSAVEALRLCRQLAISLAAAHARGIIHRDLKPENIYLIHDAEVASGERTKILDFGIAKLSDDHPDKLKTSTGMLMGTPAYMSPEQCRGLRDLDHRSDVYALGCVLFRMLTGRPPFDGEGPGDIISAHIREHAPSPSRYRSAIPPIIDMLVSRCLAKAPSERFQTMGELAAALGQLLQQMPGNDATRAAWQSSPSPATLPGNLLADPTTLGRSSGQFDSTTNEIERTLPKGSSAGRWIAGIVAGAAVVGLAIFAMRSGAAEEAPRASDPSPSHASAAPVEHATSTTSTAKSADSNAPAATHEMAGPMLSDAGVMTNSHDAESTTAIAQAADSTSHAVESSAEDGSISVVNERSKKPEYQTRKVAHMSSNSARSPARPHSTEVSSGSSAPTTSSSSPAATALRPTGASPSNSPPTDSNASVSPSRSEDVPRGASATGDTAPSSSDLERTSPSPSSSKCSKARFAEVYNATSPSRVSVEAALQDLVACHNAGVFSEDEFDRYQSALVAKMFK